ncbi:MULTISPECIES: PadR family transcriptional regulator [Pediococcus]|jgi:PadR family transcriptional regulator AphA|uniref:PadR family transcriptional regulator n=1 Tax=Pediococcus TaxID=1253 RepID=UPI00142D7DEF|nr:MULTISPECIES: PadR family transcriptional regulator [Pediococcus]KAF5438243.1 PadR family transcriptional regulator [Pediococcus sp. EKM202D]KAF5438632.1 PadR family transcriptional regulator [Pediococcus sp. EKM201D]MBF7123854.1 PadR family transcriptional regulator [Pediococcus pentosaceus]MCR1860966.1 PadR family transcriptional regulator [Pediococcus pentosaceus]WKF71583.1 PadR family transcriptional regulator [Pediococcus pentosaceus]
MPRPRVLPYIILGLLNKNGMMSGKDMISEFKTDISEFWTVSHSQLYPELQRMVDEKQIKVAEDVEVKDRKVINYVIEAKGQETLKRWLAEPITLKNDELTSLKLYCISDQRAPILQQILRQCLALHQQKVVHLKARKELLFGDESAIKANYGHYLILSRAIERESDYVNWLQSKIN